jgi:hypothetical protein
LIGRCPVCFVSEEIIGPFHLFRVKSWTGYVMNGTAEVQFDARGLSVSGMKSRECVLKFHYSQTMQAPRGATLERATVLDDPVGFVRLRVPVGWSDCRINFCRL